MRTIASHQQLCKLLMVRLFNRVSPPPNVGLLALARFVLGVLK